MSRRFAAEPDTDLVLSDLSQASLDATLADLPREVPTQLADVSDADQVEAVIRLAVERYGTLDVLISNAGILTESGRIHNLATADWERAFRVNVLGAVHGIRAAVPVMRQQKSGSIVLTASVAGMTAWSHSWSVLRDEGRGDLGRQGRRGRVRQGRDQGQLRLPRHVPVGHPRRPAAAGDRRDRGQASAGSGRGGRLVSAYAYLASEDARWTTGSALVVDGGYSAP